MSEQFLEQLVEESKPEETKGIDKEGVQQIVVPLHGEPEPLEAGRREEPQVESNDPDGQHDHRRDGKLKHCDQSNMPPVEVEVFKQAH